MITKCNKIVLLIIAVFSMFFVIDVKAENSTINNIYDEK